MMESLMAQPKIFSNLVKKFQKTIS